MEKFRHHSALNQEDGYCHMAGTILPLSNDFQHAVAQTTYLGEGMCPI